MMESAANRRGNGSPSGRHLTRRQFLQYMAWLGAAGLAACSGRNMEEYTLRPCRRGSGGATCSADLATPEAPPGGPIIWYVDLEHEDIMDDPDRSPQFIQVRNHRASVLGRIADMFCQAIHYREATLERARQDGVRAIALSGFTTDFWFYEPERLYPVCELVKKSGLPVIAFCGGHQLLAYMFGGTCGAIRKLQPGEKDLADWAPGYFKEIGYLPVTIIQDDPIFNGLGRPPVFFESHYWEVKRFPEDFVLLASTKEVEVQVMRHKECPLYGVEFHPEVYEDNYPDGLTLLTNFFRIAGIRA